MIRIHKNKDCYNFLPKIHDTVIDMILCDLPYGTTHCKWDSILDLEFLWAHYTRILKPNGIILLFGSEPFSTSLRMSNLAWYKYDWYWDKKFGGNFVNAAIMPLKVIETISVFGPNKTLPPYYPIMIPRDVPIKQGGIKTSEAIPIVNNITSHTNKVYTEKFPMTLLQFPKELGKTIHPTQKPVKLLEYLIKTHTQENAIVLDHCSGSGSTAVACIQSNRNFICIEKDADYFEKASKRIEDAVARKESENANP